jgi:hypothetical protein
VKRPRLATAVLLAGGSVVGSVLVRRRAARRREHVDLYLEDGAMISLAQDAPEAPAFLEVARGLLAGR